jgi:hypothetical protein
MNGTPAPLKRFAWFAEGTLFLMGAVHLLSAVVAVWMLQIYARIGRGEEPSEEELTTVVNLAEQADTAYIVGLLVTAIAFAAWFYRAYKNVSCFAPAAASHPPGAAVYGWIIPFVNLVRPYQIASEIWTASKTWTAADSSSEDGIGANLIAASAPAPLLVKVVLVSRITGWQDSMFPMARATVAADRQI